MMLSASFLVCNAGPCHVWDKPEMFVKTKVPRTPRPSWCFASLFWGGYSLDGILHGLVAQKGVGRTLRTMLPFSTLLLRNYYRCIGWNEDNSYPQLTRSSNGPCFPLPLISLPYTDLLQSSCAPLSYSYSTCIKVDGASKATFRSHNPWYFN